MRNGFPYRGPLQAPSDPFRVNHIPLGGGEFPPLLEAPGESHRLQRFVHPFADREEIDPRFFGERTRCVKVKRTEPRINERAGGRTGSGFLVHKNSATQQQQKSLQNAINARSDTGQTGPKETHRDLDVGSCVSVSPRSSSLPNSLYSCCCLLFPERRSGLPCYVNSVK